MEQTIEAVRLAEPQEPTPATSEVVNYPPEADAVLAQLDSLYREARGMDNAELTAQVAKDGAAQYRLAERRKQLPGLIAAFKAGHADLLQCALDAKERELTAALEKRAELKAQGEELAAQLLRVRAQIGAVNAEFTQAQARVFGIEGEVARLRQEVEQR